MPRDKFAAMVSRAADNEGKTTTTSTSTSTTEDTDQNKNNNQSSREQQQQQQQQQKQQKQSSNNIIVKLSPEEIAKQRQEYRLKLQQRLSKPKDLLDRLDRAEELTCNLLRIASKTTDALQDLHGSPDLSELSVAYHSTLQEIHPLLTKDTEELIKPYQNHTMETKQSMYAARVEMRLAKERLEVLKTFTDLEMTKEQNNPFSSSESSSRKRSRTEEA